MVCSKNNTYDKKTYYSDSKVVARYDELRFGNPGGQYVHRSESESFMKFLERSVVRRSILDIPTGTGRMLPSIHSLGFSSVSAADYSETMIRHCQADHDYFETSFSMQDIYDTTYSNSSFSAILSSRFFFHSDAQDSLFREFSRLLQPGGLLVFDTLAWSPRTWTKLWSKELGGNLYTNTRKSIERLAVAHGFNIIKVEPLFMLPSFFYNFLPGHVLGLVMALERIWPKAWMTKRIWLLRKDG